MSETSSSAIRTLVDRTSVLASAARILAHAVLVSVIKPTPTTGMILPRRFFSDFAAFFMSFLLLRVMYPDHAWQDSHITLALNAVRFIKFPHGRHL
jgi:hypothetical protein